MCVAGSLPEEFFIGFLLFLSLLLPCGGRYFRVLQIMAIHCQHCHSLNAYEFEIYTRRHSGKIKFSLLSLSA